jgi:hypothetical protein
MPLPVLRLDFSFHYQSSKVFKGSIVCPFSLRRKTTAGKLPIFKMIAQAFTANSLFVARFIRTGAFF